MTPDEAKKLWEHAEANASALHACAGPHDFVNLTPKKFLGARWRCTRCGGEVAETWRNAYLKGLRHGVEAAIRACEEPGVVPCGANALLVDLDNLLQKTGDGGGT